MEESYQNISYETNLTSDEALLPVLFVVRKRSSRPKECTRGFGIKRMRERIKHRLRGDVGQTEHGVNWVLARFRYIDSMLGFNQRRIMKLIITTKGFWDSAYPSTYAYPQIVNFSFV